MFDTNLNYINYIKNILWILIHFLFTYVVLTIALISNDMKILTILLITMYFIRFLFYYIGRCMVTSLEENDLFNNSAELFGNIILQNPKDKDVEEILINMGTIIISNKIFILSILRFYNITYFE
jgi:hypothetical protein